MKWNLQAVQQPFVDAYQRFNASCSTRADKIMEAGHIDPRHKLAIVIGLKTAAVALAVIALLTAIFHPFLFLACAGLGVALKLNPEALQIAESCASTVRTSFRQILVGSSSASAKIALIALAYLTAGVVAFGCGPALVSMAAGAYVGSRVRASYFPNLIA